MGRNLSLVISTELRVYGQVIGADELLLGTTLTLASSSPLVTRVTIQM